MAGDDTLNFNVHTLTRTDSLYFTVTVFTTVGFGDVTATSAIARGLVTVQMVLDLVVFGLVVHQFMGAVQTARQERAPRVESVHSLDGGQIGSGVLGV